MAAGLNGWPELQADHGRRAPHRPGPDDVALARLLPRIRRARTGCCSATLATSRTPRRPRHRRRTAAGRRRWPPPSRPAASKDAQRRRPHPRRLVVLARPRRLGDVLVCQRHGRGGHDAAGHRRDPAPHRRQPPADPRAPLRPSTTTSPPPRRSPPASGSRRSPRHCAPTPVSARPCSAKPVTSGHRHAAAPRTPPATIAASPIRAQGQSRCVDQAEPARVKRRRAWRRSLSACQNSISSAASS